MATAPLRKRFVDLDVRQVEQLAAWLARADGRMTNELAVNVVNAVAERTEPMLRESILATINLTDEYIRQRIVMKLAERVEADGATATIKAPANDSPLTRYQPQMRLVPAKSPLRKLKGYSALGIPRGMKLGGISVEVTRNERKWLRSSTAHFLPKKTDSSGNPMIFTRNKTTGKQRPKFGPAVYQLYRVALERYASQIESDLRSTLLEWADIVFEEDF